ncbi:LytTR family DNA-binding domain-containing protein [Phenylobacterium sp.]|jgi:hypothetical protein|uniref:LytTR family DNA-binding domain-containing protein n=1 Tax=Phenylobacterium sp. TaxID=1871053 RepID=UPI002F92A5CB
MKRLLLRLGPHEDLTGWGRTFGIAGVAAVFLTLSGAFGTHDAPAGLRLLYWILLMAVGALWGGLVARLFLRTAIRQRLGLWRGGIAAAAVMSAPFTLVVWAASTLILKDGMPLRLAPFLFVPVFVVSLMMFAVNLVVETRRAAPGAPAPPKFLERLPLKLRGAEVWAVEAEDHYLRLHTSKGQDLILMRLADAVAELEGIEGMQVHRSWWVARNAIADARRGDGRATLTLKDGSEVPVSRTYAGQLRENGWI